jgi:threonine aldolase
MAAKIMSDLPALMATVERNNVLATLLDVVTEYEPEVSSMLGGATNVERLHRVGRDFRSERFGEGDEIGEVTRAADTTTIPTDAMFLAGQQATRGDDVLEEDQSTIDLERRLAALSGKEAALFCVSGTMTNRERGVGLRSFG